MQDQHRQNRPLYGPSSFDLLVFLKWAFTMRGGWEQQQQMDDGVLYLVVSVLHFSIVLKHKATGFWCAFAFIVRKGEMKRWRMEQVNCGCTDGERNQEDDFTGRAYPSAHRAEAGKMGLEVHFHEYYSLHLCVHNNFNTCHSTWHESNMCSLE